MDVETLETEKRFFMVVEKTVRVCALSSNV